jgi:hypothetical protein
MTEFKRRLCDKITFRVKVSFHISSKITPHGQPTLKSQWAHALNQRAELKFREILFSNVENAVSVSQWSTTIWKAQGIIHCSHSLIVLTHFPRPHCCHADIWRSLYTPGQALRAPRVSRQSANKDGKVFSPTHQLSSPPPPPAREIHFCWRLAEPQGHSAAGRIKSMENPDIFGSRSRDYEDDGPPVTWHLYPGFTEWVSYVHNIDIHNINGGQISHNNAVSC